MDNQSKLREVDDDTLRGLYREVKRQMEEVTHESVSRTYDEVVREMFKRNLMPPPRRW